MSVSSDSPFEKSEKSNCQQNSDQVFFESSF